MIYESTLSLQYLEKHGTLVYSVMYQHSLRRTGIMNQFSTVKAVVIFTLVASLGIGFSTATLAQSQKGQVSVSQRQQMSQMHKKMAIMHSNMATCLESDKIPSQCRQEMLDACSASFGGECPMLGGGKMVGRRGMGMMGNASCVDWMMFPDSGEAAKATPKK